MAKGAPAADMTKRRIPQLPHVKYLTVHVYLPDFHCFGVGIENILKQCNNITSLRVQCLMETEQPISICDHLDRWQSHQIYLTHLQEVEFTGLVGGTDCELLFMQYVLSNAKQLRKVTLSYDPEYSYIQERAAMFELIRLLKGGEWTACHDACLSYEWKHSL